MAIVSMKFMQATEISKKTSNSSVIYLFLQTAGGNFADLASRPDADEYPVTVNGKATEFNMPI